MAARRLKRDIQILDIQQAVEAIAAELKRVNMSAFAHMGATRRFSSTAPSVASRSVKTGWDVDLFTTYIPWARTLGLNVVIIDGEDDFVIEDIPGLNAFADTALKRRDMKMQELVRDAQAAGHVGSRAFKGLRHGWAKEIRLSSLLGSTRFLGTPVVLRPR